MAPKEELGLRGRASVSRSRLPGSHPVVLGSPGSVPRPQDGLWVCLSPMSPPATSLMRVVPVLARRWAPRQAGWFVVLFEPVLDSFCALVVVATFTKPPYCQWKVLETREWRVFCFLALPATSCHFHCQGQRWGLASSCNFLQRPVCRADWLSPSPSYVVAEEAWGHCVSLG